MGRTRVAEFRLPDEDGFADMVRELKLDQKQQAMLQTTLEEVAANCKGAGAGPPDKQIKTALKSLEKAFDRLQLQLKRQDVIDALGAIESYGAMGYLFSATAAAGLANGADPRSRSLTSRGWLPTNALWGSRSVSLTLMHSAL